MKALTRLRLARCSALSLLDANSVGVKRQIRRELSTPLLDRCAQPDRLAANRAARAGVAAAIACT
jgi:hypothetical protein